MKTLYIITKGMGKPSDEQIIKMEESDSFPRVTVLDRAISATLLDERHLENRYSGFRRWLYRHLPVTASQVLEALLIHKKYDVILVHDEKVAFPLTLLMRLLQMRPPLVMTLSRITSNSRFKTKVKMLLLKMTRKRIDRIILWSSEQRRILMEKGGVPPEKIRLIKKGTDERFWRPLDCETDKICSVGMEMRDFPTLVKALAPLKIPCHLATGAARGVIFDTVRTLFDMKDLPPHITVGSLAPLQLRKLYARSRFLVISLLPTDSDNGLTAILEAMAMGKPVICTKVEGQVDVIEDGVTGIYVPQGDPDALRDAVSELWNDPEKARLMGLAARDHIEANHSMDQYALSVRDTLGQAIKSRNASALSGRDLAMHNVKSL